MLLRYSLQKVRRPSIIRIVFYLRPNRGKGYIPLPKSASKKRIESNVQVFDFELTKEEVSQLDGLDEGKAGRVFA